MNANQIYLIFFLGTLILTIFSFFLILFLVHYKRRQQLFQKEKLMLEYQYQSQLLQTRLEVQEQSFQYFSEEIHDNIGQQFTICKLQLHQLQDYCKEDGFVLLQQTTDTLSKALSDLRNISHTLNGNFISKKGLYASLKQEISNISSIRKVQILFDVEGEIMPLGNEKELLIFRIIQEAITNALKHSAPERIMIRLHYEPALFTVKIIDDGKGFVTISENTGLGLHNMQLRAALLNGTISFDSSGKTGTVVTLKIDLT